LLDARALAEAEPNLRGGLAGGLLVPGDSVLYSPLAAVELIRRATERGAEVLVGPRVVEFDEGEIVLNDGSRVSVGAIVLATGALAARLLPGLEVRPRKGHLVITDRYPGFIRHQTVELGYLKSAHSRDAESVAFNIQPRATGQLLIGSSRQFGASDLRVDREIVGRMLRRAFEFMPGLRALQAIRVWTGFRAATPDGLPIVGPHPERPGLWLATGHEGLGITTSLGSARLLADRMLGRPTAIPIEPYLPDRFAHQAAAHG
jgi:glycine/D-amino acid oxidase-like deaminating enzyme